MRNPRKLSGGESLRGVSLPEPLEDIVISEFDAAALARSLSKD